MEVDVHQAEAKLAHLIDRALSGDEVVITKAGKPLVRLAPVEPRRPQLGTARGTITFHPGWDDPLSSDDVERIFGHRGPRSIPTLPSGIVL